MIDGNWELIDGEAAHAIEVLNYSNQVNVIEALVRFLMYHKTGPDGACAEFPNQWILQEFHRTATLFLLKKPGQFREEEVVVRTDDGTVVHAPPTCGEMGQHVINFFTELGERWTTSSAQEIAAFCLWMINWVHPFKNGNGRTARAFSYACLSLRLGFVLPGTLTVIDLIMQNRDEYQHALKEADVAFEAGQPPALDRMTAFIDRLLAEQLSSIPD